MRIDAVDLFYLAMPTIRDIGDGSQDALLVRVRAGDLVGWGECEAAPLVSIASWCCPMSHMACKPVSASILGQTVETADDIRRINALVHANSFDLLQADHTLSGIDIALWDLLGKRLGQPVYRLLGYERAYPKRAYASVLFGDTPEETFQKAQAARQAGFAAAKFGWGPYGRGSNEEDTRHVEAARSGLGERLLLLVDAGTVWGEEVALAQQRIAALNRCGAVWLEEPFVNGALGAYHELSRQSGSTRLAGGEGCNNFPQAKNMVDFAGLGFLQIDAGRIGGITVAKQAADYAQSKGVQYVNHTFTTQLALNASLQPFAGLAAHDLCEYPVEPSALAAELTKTKLVPDGEGRLQLPDAPGLGIEPDPAAIRKYLQPVEMRVGDRVVYRTPEV